MRFKSGVKWFFSEEGVTAIEFSLLALPFTFFILAIIELSLLFVGQSVLNGAVQDAARMIKTGQAQQDADPEEMFRVALCDHASMMLNCANVQYQVERIASFDDADLQPELDEDGNMIDTPFEPGESSDVVIIRATYLYPLMTPVIGAFFSDFPGNKKMLMSTIVLEAEPYSFEDEI